MVAVNPAGLVLVIAGVWITSQVLAGNALQRLGIVKTAAAAGPAADPALIGGIAAGNYLPGGTYNPPYIDLNRIFGGK